MHEVMDFLARMLLISLMVALLLAINSYIWRKVWANRKDWPTFIAYTWWRWRNRKAVKNKAARVAGMMRDWADDIEQAATKPDDNQRGTAAESEK